MAGRSERLPADDDEDETMLIHPESLTHAPRRGLLAYLSAGAAAALKAYRGRRALRKLIEVDDRMLRDIGVTRDDVRQALTMPVAHDPSTYLRLRAVSRRATVRAQASKPVEATGTDSEQAVKTEASC